ncbi:MAG: hypothetical protein ACK4SY_02680 [Pyrobaculum sp.]
MRYVVNFFQPLKPPQVVLTMEIIALSRGPAPRTYYVAHSPPRCGQLAVRLMELPTDVDPPFTAYLVSSRWGTALLNIAKIHLADFLLPHLENVIEGEVKGGVLEGVVCNKKVKIRVGDGVRGAVLAVVPVVKTMKKLPPTAFNLYLYNILEV